VSEQPRLETERLVLRPLTLVDAPRIQRLAGAREIAAGTIMIPHPYGDGVAEAFVAARAAAFENGAAVTFAIVPRGETELCGVVGLSGESEHRRAELGYWLGVPWWGRGYATVAAIATVRHGFEQMALHRVHACHFRNNPASGAVLRKLGMRYEGCSRQHVFKWGESLDLDQYGILRSEWEALQRPGSPAGTR
jgi:[ribosomal protein S5]-alanine N-acetyltransferase